VQISWECTPRYQSAGISNLLQPAQSEVVSGQLSTYLASWVDAVCLYILLCACYKWAVLSQLSSLLMLCYTSSILLLYKFSIDNILWVVLLLLHKFKVSINFSVFCYSKPILRHIFPKNIFKVMTYYHFWKLWSYALCFQSGSNMEKWKNAFYKCILDLNFESISTSVFSIFSKKIKITSLLYRLHAVSVIFL
jgi:hypothetical protein